MYAENTQRAYDKAWTSYVEWCGRTQNTPLNGDPLLIARYLNDAAGRLAFNSLRVHLTAITRRHRATGLSIDTKHEAIASVISRAKREGVTPTRPAVPLVPMQLSALTRCLPGGPIGMRDRAILLVGYWLGMNLQELVALRRENLVPQGDNIAVRFPSEPESLHHSLRLILRPSFVPAACPVRAVNEWLAVRGEQDGPLFPRILKGGKVTREQISSIYVNLLIKRLANEAGFDAGILSGRSLRTGVAGLTTFGRAGARLRGVSDFSRDLPSRTAAKGNGDEILSNGPEGIGPISFDSSARWEIRLGLLIDELSRLQSAVVTERMKHLGTTRIQYIAITEIDNASGLAQSDLARRLNLTNVGVSGLVSRMVAGGWVVRQSDANDSRVRRLYLTEKAQEILRELRHIVEEVTLATFRNIADDDGYDLVRMLAGIKTILVALSSSGVSD